MLEKRPRIKFNNITFSVWPNGRDLSYNTPVCYHLPSSLHVPPSHGPDSDVSRLPSRAVLRPVWAKKCSIKWSCSCLLSLRVWKSLKTGQIVKMKTILVPAEGKRCARSPLPLHFPHQPMRSWHFVSLPVPLKKKTKPYTCCPFPVISVIWTRTSTQWSDSVKLL